MTRLPSERLAELIERLLALRGTLPIDGYGQATIDMAVASLRTGGVASGPLSESARQARDTNPVSALHPSPTIAETVERCAQIVEEFATICVEDFLPNDPGEVNRAKAKVLRLAATEIRRAHGKGKL